MHFIRVKGETAENVRNGAGLLCLEVLQRISPVREKDNTRCKEKDKTHQTRAESFNITKRRMLAKVRPSQLAELSRSEFDPELFSHSANDKFFCEISDKSAVFNILRQNETFFDKGNREGGNKEKRKCRE